MPESVWVARLSISSAVYNKLADKHDLDGDEVRRHVQGVSGLEGAWHYHHDRGWRLLLSVPMEGRRLLVVLYPRDGEEDAWNLGSAYDRP